MTHQCSDEDRVEIALSTTERNLILENSDCVADDIRAKLVFGLQRGSQLVYRMTVEDLSKLLQGLAADVETADNRETRSAFLRLLDRLDLVLEPMLEPEPDDDYPEAGPFSAMMTAKVDEFLQENPDASLAEVNEFMQRQVKIHNETPMAEFHGFSPLELTCLLQCPERCAIFNDNIPDEKLKDVGLVRRAQVFLHALAAGKVKATTAGNMNRKSVKHFDELLYPDRQDHRASRGNKVMNEMDRWPLHILRLLLQESGFLRKYRGNFVLTKKGTGILAEGQTGKLYAALFRAMFFKINLGYASAGPDWPYFQHTVFYSIAALGRVGREWTDEVDLGEKVIFPPVMEVIPTIAAYPEFDVFHMRNHLFSPLELFGLLEANRDMDREVERITRRCVRITPLYDLFLSFGYSEALLRAPEAGDGG